VARHRDPAPLRHAGRDPCRVGAEPRMAADIADRLAAEGQPCYAVVERWQIIGAPEPAGPRGGAR